MKYRQIKNVLTSTMALLSASIVAMLSNVSNAAEVAKQTFIIQGLHCPPCTRTVESSLKAVTGVQSVKVDWASKNAWVTFDENRVSSQEIADRIAATRHMMGRAMRYQGTLALKVPGVGDAVVRDKATAALKQLDGVAEVFVYPQQDSISVQFQTGGKLTAEKLVAALKAAGLDAKSFD